jgi:predicted Zn-dependent protease with MMP-like domain
MDLEELKKTEVWELFEKGKNYLRLNNVYTDTDRNYQFFNGNQWQGAKIEGIEQAQYNFIETIVNYKVSTINQNLYQIHFSSENFEHREFRAQAERTCELLDRKASRVWEKDQLDVKVKEMSYDACINDEGIMYVDYDEETQSPVNEIIDKQQVHYGNEQSSDIQSQPYIILSQRKPVTEVQEIARAEGVSEEKIKNILGDNDTQEEAGQEAKIEKDDMCTIVTKMWKEKGTVHFSKSTKYVDLIKDEDSGLHLYPISHFVWKEKKGWSRGEGEVRYLIPNQLELNKTLARCLLSIKQCAYAQKVANMEKISNPAALNQIGGIIKTKGGATVEDVNKIFTYIQPASMSTDVSRVMNELITITRELKNSSDIATGGIDPEKASGKAILAVQQASQQPLTMQSIALNQAIENMARIWLDMWTVYTPDGMKLEEEETDEETGETYIQLVDVPAVVLENLKGTVKLDVTSRTPYDKYAQELSLENMYKLGAFNPQKISETRLYAEALPDDATMPKQKILEICDKVDEQQQKIAESEMQAKLMQERANQFLSKDADEQAEQIDEIENEPVQ